MEEIWPFTPDDKKEAIEILQADGILRTKEKVPMQISWKIHIFKVANSFSS